MIVFTDYFRSMNSDFLFRNVFISSLVGFKNGTTALHFAATKGKIEFVRELLNHNADVNAEDNVSGSFFFQLE